MSWLLAAQLLWFSVTTTSTGAEENPIIYQQLTIGIQANEGATRAIEAWAPTGDLFNRIATEQGLPFRFRLEPHSDTSLLDGIGSGEIDLIFADAATFVVAEVEESVRALLSRGRIWKDATYDQTGAVIFVRADSDILQIGDIPGRDIMGVTQTELTGWQLALQEFRKYRLDVDEISEKAIFSIGNQREVVYAVQNGLVDVGVIRAGVLESLADQGVISLDDFRPISRQQHIAFPFWVSTPLYPDSVIAAMPNVPDTALAMMIDTLLQINENSSATIAANRAVWQAPQNYQPVHELLISLRARPYENHLSQAAKRIFDAYRWPFIGLTLLIIGSLSFLIFEARRNARLREEQKDVLKSAVRSKQFYRNAIEDHTVFCMLTKDGIISHVNDRFVQVLERGRSSLIDYSISDFMHASNKETIKEQIFEAMSVGAPWQGAIQLTREDGKPAWVQSTFIPVTGTSNKLSEIAIVASDVTKTRQGVSETRFNDTLELIQDKVVVLQPGTLKILHMNSAAVDTLIDARMGGTWVGKNAGQFLTNDDLETLQLRCDAIEEGPQRRMIWEAPAKDDITYEISLEYVQLGGDEPRIIAIYRDVSERKIVEKVKNEFIATVSHELRTPLTSIKGALGLATSGAVGELPEKMGGIINMAASSCDRLVMLINDILDLEKIEAGKMDFDMQVLDLEELLEAAINSNAFYAEKFNVSFEQRDRQQGIKYLTYGDPSRLMQVLDNVMSNAAKFSNPDGKILVGLFEARDCVRISVRDHGDGIPEKAQPTIFDKFTQADSSDTRSKGGTGLGLSIVKLIVEHHKGRVYFVSKEGQGTEFFIDLPKVNQDEVIPLSRSTGPEFIQSEFTDAPSLSAPAVAEDKTKAILASFIEIARQEGFDAAVRPIGKLTDIAAANKSADEARQNGDLITSQQSEFLGHLLDREFISNRDVYAIDISDPANALTAIALRDTVGSVISQRGVSEFEGQFSGDEKPCFLAIASERGLRSQLLEKGIVPVSDGAQALVHPTFQIADAIMQFEASSQAATLTIYPNEQGKLSQNWPVVMLVSRGETAKSGLGVVSKFSSGGGNRSRRKAS